MGVSFGVVGLGMGMQRAKMVTETQGAVLGGVCDLNPERLKKVSEELHCKGFSDYKKMLKDDKIEVIYVMTPSGTHLDFGEQAAKAGKHVITTKPFEITVTRCERFMEVCEKNRVKLVVDFDLRYRPEIQHWKAAVDAGEFGDILFAEGKCKWWRDQAYYDAGGWRGTWKMDGGGSAANQGIHILDLFVWFCGDPEVIAARYGAFGHKIETEDLAVAILELPNGKTGVITTTTNHHLNDEYGIAISGACGSGTNLFKKVQVKFEDGREELKTPPPSAPRNAVEDMVGVLTNNSQPYVSGQEGTRSIRLLEKIYRAGKQH